MNRAWWLAACLATAGCDPDTKDADTTDVDTTDTADTDTDSVVDTRDGCTIGFAVGECPRDFSLINQDGDTVVFTEQVGQPMVIIGSAEW